MYSVFVNVMGREFRSAGVYPLPGVRSPPLPAMKAGATKKAAAGGLIEDVRFIFYNRKGRRQVRYEF